MTIKSLLPIFIFILIANFTYAQEYCGTKDLDEAWISYYHSNKALFAQEDNKTIYAPMKLTLLRDDDGNGEISFILLYRTLSKLNADFEQVGVQYFLSEDFVKIDKTSWYFHEDFSGGSQMMRANNISSAINCYIVRNPAGNCGYYSGQRDGLVVGMNCMGGSSSTWTHEMGHLLTLPHTFFGCEGVTYDSKTDVNEFQNEIRGTLEKVDGSNCSTAADRFCDTKPDYLSYRWQCNADGESSLLQSDVNGKTFRSNGQLFMSYSNDVCTGIFSGEQNQAMRANLQGRRSAILKDTTPQVRNLADDIELEMIIPKRDETVHFQNINLEWKEIENATHYYVEVSRRSGFTTSSTIRKIVTEPILEIDELVLDKKYYVRVLPFNLSAFNQDFLEIFEFRTSDLTGINESGKYSNINIPSLLLQGDNLTFSGIDNNHKDLSFSVSNLIGQDMLSGRFPSSLSIPTHQLQKGVYIISLRKNSKDIYTKKFIIQ